MHALAGYVLHKVSSLWRWMNSACRHRLHGAHVVGLRLVYLCSGRKAAKCCAAVCPSVIVYSVSTCYVLSAVCVGPAFTEIYTDVSCSMPLNQLTLLSDRSAVTARRNDFTQVLCVRDVRSPRRGNDQAC